MALTDFRLLSRNDAGRCRHRPLVRPLRAKRGAQRFRHAAADAAASSAADAAGRAAAAERVRLAERLARLADLGEQHFAAVVRVAQISQTRQIAALLQIDLGLDEQRVETIQKEVPAQHTPIGQRVVQLVQRLQHNRSVHNEQIELRFETEQQRSDGLVVDGAQIEGGTLRHVHADVVHAGDEVTEGGGESGLQADLGAQRRGVHEAVPMVDIGMLHTV